MPKRFSEKVAIITGSSFGIEGAKVTVTGRNEERLQGTKKALIDAGMPESHFVIVPADITTSDEQDSLIAETLNKFGKINILVNNAGASLPDAQKKFGIDQGVDTYKKVMKLNVQCIFQSVIEMTQKVRPHLAKSKGEIVNASSVVALKFGWARTPYYSLAKAALDQYTRSAAIDLISEGIRVNTVNPGIVQTGFHESATGTSSDVSQKFYDDMGSNRHAIPVGFSGRPTHIAKDIAFLADRDSSEYIIGQNIIADGGTSLVLGLHAQFPKPTVN